MYDGLHDYASGGSWPDPADGSPPDRVGSDRHRGRQSGRMSGWPAEAGIGIHGPPVMVLLNYAQTLLTSPYN
jgi:hypothetical protein